MADDPPRSIDLEFTHTRVLVPEFRACFRFYRDVLDFDVEWGDEDGVYADLRTGGVTLALFDQTAMATVVGTAAGPGGDGDGDAVALVFQVESVDAAYERLRTEVPFDTEPHDRPGWGIRVAHFRDPAGTLIEINEPLASEG